MFFCLTWLASHFVHFVPIIHFQQISTLISRLKAKAKTWFAFEKPGPRHAHNHRVEVSKLEVSGESCTKGLCICTWQDYHWSCLFLVHLAPLIGVKFRFPLVFLHFLWVMYNLQPFHFADPLFGWSVGEYIKGCVSNTGSIYQINVCE